MIGNNLFSNPIVPHTRTLNHDISIHNYDSNDEIVTRCEYNTVLSVLKDKHGEIKGEANNVKLAIGTVANVVDSVVHEVVHKVATLASKNEVQSLGNDLQRLKNDVQNHGNDIQHLQSFVQILKNAYIGYRNVFKRKDQEHDIELDYHDENRKQTDSHHEWKRKVISDRSFLDQRLTSIEKKEELREELEERGK